MKKKSTPTFSLPKLIVSAVVLVVVLFGLKMLLFPSVVTDVPYYFRKQKIRELSPADLVGTYTAELPAADSSGRIMTLVLTESGAATLSADYQNDQPAIIHTGMWTFSTPHYAIVTLNEQDGEELTPPILIRFGRAHNRLVAVEYDQNLFGSYGLRLFYQPEPEEVLDEPLPTPTPEALTVPTPLPAADSE